MKKFLILLVILMIPFHVKAERFNEDIVAYDVKYYKSILINSSSLTTLYSHNYLTFEISEDEYNLADSKASLLSTTITDYKKMETTISSSGKQYVYNVKLTWKKMPKVRSYDIIGIGFLPSVTIDGNVSFIQQYCTSSTDCTTNTSGTIKMSNTGVTAVFKLPNSTSYTSMNQSLSFKVKKNTTSSIIKQVAAGDYSHAISSITSSNTSYHSINSIDGIVLAQNISNYYDSINSAIATWSGSW